jgi:hypothetical protein
VQSELGACSLTQEVWWPWDPTLGQVCHGSPFAMAWLEWKNSDKIWVGFGNPCTDMDMDIFYAATTITLGNGCNTSFWFVP